MSSYGSYGYQQIFLDMIKKMSMMNPEEIIDVDFVYRQLVNFRVEQYEGSGVNIENIFPDLMEYFKDVDNMRVFRSSNKPFLYFANGEVKGNEIKIYMPMDIFHIKESALDIFSFMAKENIEHQSKISSRIRNDDLVVRVNNLEDTEKIIDYVSDNYTLKEGLLKINPFVPNYNGIGFAMDNNYSYNRVVSTIISNYFNILKDKDRLDLFTVSSMNTYIKEIIPEIIDLDLKDIYTLISKVTTPDFSIDKFVEHAKYKAIDKYENRKRITDPKYYLENAVMVTENKHKNNGAVAIKEYLKGNPKCFTRDKDARSSILKYVDPSNLISLMRYKLFDNNISIPRSDNDLINIYLEILKKEDRIKDFNVIKKAYINTFDSYGYKQANYALGMLINNKDVRCFTNKFKDRNNLKDIVDKDIKEIVISNIGDDGIDPNNIDDIVNKFSYMVFEDDSRSR